MEEYYQEEFTAARKEPLSKGIYEDCSFKQLDLSDQDLAEFKFIDCIFEECNLSNCKLRECAFQECEFSASKLMGLHFEDCKAFNFGIRFSDSQLSHSIFYQMDLTNCSFSNCDLEEVDFTEANLEGVEMTKCNLMLAVFDRSKLTKIDLTASSNLQIDPENNQLNGAKIPSEQLAGLLAKYGIEVV